MLSVTSSRVWVSVMTLKKEIEKLEAVEKAKGKPVLTGSEGSDAILQMIAKAVNPEGGGDKEVNKEKKTSAIPEGRPVNKELGGVLKGLLAHRV